MLSTCLCISASGDDQFVVISGSAAEPSHGALASAATVVLHLKRNLSFHSSRLFPALQAAAGAVRFLPGCERHCFVATDCSEAAVLVQVTGRGQTEVASHRLRERLVSLEAFAADKLLLGFDCRQIEVLACKL